MDEQLIEKYKKQMFEMYYGKSRPESAPSTRIVEQRGAVGSSNQVRPINPTPSTNQIPQTEFSESVTPTDQMGQRTQLGPTKFKNQMNSFDSVSPADQIPQSEFSEPLTPTNQMGQTGPSGPTDLSGRVNSGNQMRPLNPMRPPESPDMIRPERPIRPSQPMRPARPLPPSRPSAQPGIYRNGTGKLIAIVTTLRSLYPVENAKVTVFNGDVNNMEVVATAFTDDSGRTEAFVLDAPSKELSLEADNTTRPYALYNMMVQADGFVDNIHLNIPIFEAVTSLKKSDMMLLETSGADKGPRVFNEIQNYTL